MEFPCRLRLLDWKAYPRKSLPPTFNPEYLVELYMRSSQLEKLWEGTQPLQNFKKMVLSRSKNLKELPDLSNAINLERLDLWGCESLVEIPSSFSHLHKLQGLDMSYCVNLQVIPAHMNLASLVVVNLEGCSRLRNIPLMSTNIGNLNILNTAVKDVPPLIRLCSRLRYFSLSRCKHLNLNLRGLTHLPKSVRDVDLSWTDIERIPDCIQALHQLERLHLSGCGRLTSLPELPGSLRFLKADNCESLEAVFCPLSTPQYTEFMFTNCFKLGQQARKWIIRRSFCYSKTLLPGGQLPAEFDHRARGSSLTIVLDGNRSYSGFVFCVVLSPNQQIMESQDPLMFLSTRRMYNISWSRIIAQDDGYPVEGSVSVITGHIWKTEHLFIFRYSFKGLYRSEVNREMMFEFSSKYDNFDIVECGAKTLTPEESIDWSYKSGSDQVFEDDNEFEPSEEAFEEDDTDSCKKRRKLCFEEEGDRK